MTDHVAGDGLSIEMIEGGFRVTGLIDLSTVDGFRQGAAAAVVRGTDLVVDLSSCTFIGSEGIGVLIDTLRAVEPGRLILRSQRGVISKVLKLSGFAKFPNVEMATA